ncbi:MULTISPECIES: SPOR domain-containing protein [unclassified Sphingomonas]|uniref:SPOR domain-containing protein n=1 Tax=unclassified Sphingomonas TaxID=196159 RepID=UPI0012E3E283|nr:MULTISPECIES: SPOR domain-containing protein [unclassified Sphingomonas]
MKSNISVVAMAALLGACGFGGGDDLEELPPAPAAPQAKAPAAPGAGYGAPEGSPATGEGPQGSSRLRPGEERYDRVGYAGYAGAGEGVFALSGVLPQGSHAEVTALDSGKTILVLIRGQGNGLIELSGGAARQLGVSGNPPVRVRRVSVTGQDATMLAAGQAAPMRADAPPALLAGLRRRLGETPRETAAERPTRPATRPTPRPTQAATRGLFVQVAALSNAARARALADELDGSVRPGGGVYRVQLGPYPNSSAAERARADVARRGYGDARIVSIP